MLAQALQAGVARFASKLRILKLVIGYLSFNHANAGFVQANIPAFVHADFSGFAGIKMALSGGSFQHFAGFGDFKSFGG